MESLQRLFLTAFIIFASFSLKAQEVRFTEYPSINLKVEDFANTLIEALFPELENPNLKFKRNANDDVINEMSRGQIHGQFSSTLPLGKIKARANLDFAMEMAVEPTQKKEYQINFYAEGSLSHSQLFMAHLVGRLATRCDHNEMPKASCQWLSPIRNLNSAEMNPGEVMTLWKEQLLRGFVENQSPGFQPIKEEFIQFLDDNIKVEIGQPGQASLSMNLGDLATRFRGKAYEYLNARNLIDFSLQNLEVNFDDNQMTFSLHLAKYHVIKSFNQYMQLAKSFQNTFEDPDVAAELGVELRKDTTRFKSQFLFSAHRWDAAKAALAYRDIRRNGTRNEVPAVTAEEQNLGLD